MNDKMEKGNIVSVELTKLPIAVEETLDDYVLVKHGLQIEQFQSEMLRGMVYRIKTYILAEEIDNRKKDVRFKYSVPSNWWQHFKRDIFPQWLLRRYPVVYVEYYKIKTVTFRKYATYPKANILFPDKVGDLVRYKSSIEEG